MNNGLSDLQPGIDGKIDPRDLNEPFYSRPHGTKHIEATVVNLPNDGPNTELKAANDNLRPQEESDNSPKVEYRQKESWPLIDQITRGNLDSDKIVQAKLLKAVHRIRHTYDLAHIDVAGLSIHQPGKTPSVDNGLQRNKHGNVMFAHGQTLDRKKALRAVKVVEGADPSEERHDGAVRRSDSGVVDNSGFNPHRDDPVAFRKVEARFEIEEIAVALGPLWPHVQRAVCGNATLTEIGQALGAKGNQSSGVGNAIVRLGLEAAIAAFERIDQSHKHTSLLSWLRGQLDDMAVPARRLKRALAELEQVEGRRAA